MMIKHPLLRLDVALFIRKYFTWLLLALIVLFYIIFMTNQSVLRYTTFRATAFDLGNMDQAIWNTIHGRPFQFTNQGSDNYGPPTRLATHVEPIIFLLSLLYLFQADPRILLVFQTLALAAGALPVFLLARKYLPTLPVLAPVLAGAYLISPALLGLNIYDFHPVSLATPLLLYAMLALTYRRYAWFILACILASACKEDVPLAVAMLGLLVIWKYKLPRLGSLLFLGGILWSAIAFLVVIPYFFPGAQHSNYWYRYEATLGSSPAVGVVNILLHPWLPFTLFLTLDRVYYLASLLRSTGFLALLAPEWLLPTLPSLAVNLFASGGPYYSGVYQYNAAIIPFVMLAAIHGIRRIVLLWYRWRGEPFDLLGEPFDLLQEEHVLLSARRLPMGKLQLPRFASLSFLGSTLFTWLALVCSNIIQTLSRPPLWHWLGTHIRPCLSYCKQLVLRRWQLFGARMSDLALHIPVPLFQWCISGWLIVMFLLNLSIMTPALNTFWADHLPGIREQQIQHVLSLIPPDASVSAGGNLNPHLTDRRYVTVFPELTYSTLDPGVKRTVNYVIVDLDDLSPEDRSRSANFLNVLNQLQRSHQFRQIAQSDGVILLVRNSP